MTNNDETTIFRLLSAGLRERANDVGDERMFASQVAAAATAVPQRRALLRWPDAFTRRAGLILVAGLVGIGLIAAAIGGSSRPAPTPAASKVSNGPILVIDSRISWWVDATSGAKLTGPGYPDMPEGIQDASFSADGQRVALVVDGALELFEIATGQRTVIASCPALGWQCLLETERRFSIDWSPDGRSIAVAVTTGLIIVDVETGSITRVTEPVVGSVRFSSPSWSPDGRWIAYEFFRGGTPMSEAQYVEAIRPDGSQRHRISAAFAEDSGAEIPSWSPDGTQVLYLTRGPHIDTGMFQTSGSTKYAMAQPVVDGLPTGKPVQVAELVFFFCLGFCPTFTLSPDGADILLDSGNGIFVVPVDGGTRRELGNEVARPLAWRPFPIGR